MEYNWKIFGAGQLIGAILMLYVLYFIKISPQHTWEQWKTCAVDRPSYVSDSTFRALRPAPRVPQVEPRQPQVGVAPCST